MAIFLQNAFWSLRNSEVHRAMSFDRLHAFQGGLFGQHLFKEFKARVEELGRVEAAQVDMQ